MTERRSTIGRMTERDSDDTPSEQSREPFVTRLKKKLGLS